jgi:hypothetical protein
MSNLRLVYITNDHIDVNCLDCCSYFGIYPDDKIECPKCATKISSSENKIHELECLVAEKLKNSSKFAKESNDIVHNQKVLDGLKTYSNMRMSEVTIRVFSCDNCPNLLRGRLKDYCNVCDLLIPDSDRVRDIPEWCPCLVEEKNIVNPIG